MVVSAPTTALCATAPTPSFERAVGKMNISKRLSATALFILLAGCSGSLEDSECPRIGLLPDAERITVFNQTGGQDITDVVGTGKIEGLSSSCEVNDDGQIYVTLEIGLAAALGPTTPTQPLVLPYFVAVTDADQQVLTKEPARFTVQFDDEDRAVRSKVEVDTFPMPGVGRFVREEYVVVVGFQLTPNQLNYNRRSGN